MILDLAPLAALAIIALWLVWAWDAFRRWCLGRWRAFKLKVARAPIDLPRWLWRKAVMLCVPDWLSADDFYLTDEWRKTALTNKRDYGWCCAWCGISQQELPGKSGLHSHHMKKRRLYPWLALVLSNLACLCPPCHVDVEHGRKRLTWRGGRWVAS